MVRNLRCIHISFRGYLSDFKISIYCQRAYFKSTMSQTPNISKIQRSIHLKLNRKYINENNDKNIENRI